MHRDPDALIDTALADHRRRVAHRSTDDGRRYRRDPRTRIGRVLGR